MLQQADTSFRDALVDVLDPKTTSVVLGLKVGTTAADCRLGWVIRDSLVTDKGPLRH